MNRPSVLRRAILVGCMAAGVVAGGSAAAGAANIDPGAVAAKSHAFSAIPGSFRPTTDVDMGEFSSGNMTVEVVLAPSHGAQLSDLLTGLYKPSDARYHNWLAKGEFQSRFAPSDAQIGAVKQHLSANGLTVEASSSPFLVRASGSSRAVAAAFGTSLHSYSNRNGIAYFSNASRVELPTSVASGVLGVVGLSNTVRARPRVSRPLARPASATANCEAPYPTPAQLLAVFNGGPFLPVGYGGSRGCNGLTPSQVNSIYGAPNVGPRGKGAGVNLAVFELSAYQHSDIAKWALTSYGPAFTPPLADITIDGGPLNPICPAGDTCPPEYNGYSGDVEVDADIETQLTISPAASHILVYNAPNDDTGQTSLDEFGRIAQDDLADVISSSWGECENDVGAAYAQAENLIFEQIALQGQSMFSAAGDSGAFDCILTDGTTLLNVDDPPSQPWVTSVGGTSFEAFNPDATEKPVYPAGVETVWNNDDLCNTKPKENGASGLDWCGFTGAGGGGNSQFWGRPFYQAGPGVTNPYTTYGNGATQCSLAATGTPCRETPDVSANADPFTGYAEYCTGSADTPYSACADESGESPPGWFAIGGTSLSSPLWSAIVADRVGFTGQRIGNANPLLYSLYITDYAGYFNDITGKGQKTNNNGYFPTMPGYDQATGIGTPKMKALITGVP